MLELLQSHHFERALDARRDIGLWSLSDRKWEGDVLLDAHVREERVVLEHHADIALIRRKPIDRLAGEGDHALARSFEAGQHIEGGGLTGTGWPEERQEFAAPDRQTQSFDGLEVAIHFFSTSMNSTSVSSRLLALLIALSGRLAVAPSAFRPSAGAARSPGGLPRGDEARFEPAARPPRAVESCVVETN